MRRPEPPPVWAGLGVAVGGPPSAWTIPAPDSAGAFRMTEPPAPPPVPPVPPPLGLGPPLARTAPSTSAPPAAGTYTTPPPLAPAGELPAQPPPAQWCC